MSEEMLEASSSKMPQSAGCIKRSVSLPRTTVQPSKFLTPLKQTKTSSYRGEQPPSPSPALSSSVFLSRNVQSRTPKPQKPNTLNFVKSRSCKPQIQPIHGSTLPSSKRVGTPVNASMADSTSVRMHSNMFSVEFKSMGASQNPYGTVPRRRKQKSVEDLLKEKIEMRSSSASCDARMSASMGPGARKQLQLSCSGMSSNSSSAYTTPTQTHAGRWPIHLMNNAKNTPAANTPRKPKSSKSQKTLIYYEQSVQTSLTNDDMIKLFAVENNDLPGPVAVRTTGDGSNYCEQETQCTDIRDVEMEKLRDEVRQLSANLQRERDEKMLLQDELQRQQDVHNLRQLCHSLQTEIERSAAAQQKLLEEKAAVEKETSEMQDFLQHEKTAMHEALRDLETEFEACKAKLSHREEVLKAVRESCQSLVRLNEQRRQENLLLQTKFNSLKDESQNAVFNQHSSISVAYRIVSNLHGRLHDLVNNLKLAYNLSEPESEEPSIQNETYVEAESKSIENIDAENQNGNNNEPNNYFQKNHLKSPLELPLPNNADADARGGGDGDVDADDDGVPQRDRTFIEAIMAATTPSKRPLADHPSSSVESRNSLDPLSSNGNSTDYVENNDMLDSETEPCLMMDNVLEDVKMPDTHSQNMVTQNASSFSPDIELLNALNTEVILGENLSLHNLSQAIVNRQNMEMQTNESCAEDEVSSAWYGDFIDANALVEIVNDADLLLTRLLRIFHIDNDSCLQKVIFNHELLLKENKQLKDELKDVTQELMSKNAELNRKSDLQNHANEIDVRF